MSEHQTIACNSRYRATCLIWIRPSRQTSLSRLVFEHHRKSQSTPVTMQFSSKSFRSTLPNSLAAKYRKALQKHPFALFGLPFLATIVAGSFMLTPATALRYERYDRKNQQITQEEAMGLGQNRRKVNMKDEYYVSTLLHVSRLRVVIWSRGRVRLLRAITNKFAEITSEGPRGLGAEACQATARRARRYPCMNRYFL